jgi:rod shape-determining protein MreC
VQVNRTGARSIALGTGRSGLLSLPYMPQNTDIIVGDLLVSSGLGGVYPPGYPVAKVTAVTRDTGQPLLAVEAEPLAGLDRDPEILLVWFDREVMEPEEEAVQATGAPAEQTPPASPPAPTPAPTPASTPAPTPTSTTAPTPEAAPEAARETAPEEPPPTGEVA